MFAHVFCGLRHAGRFVFVDCCREQEKQSLRFVVFVVSYMHSQHVV